MAKSPRYIFVMGGVLSGLGKGIAVSSIAKLLQAKGYRVTAMKIDPYINVDAGTMNPTEHGEVFVTHDGLETDQDIGNYERFLDTALSRDSYMTTGMVYLSVIQRERNLEYRGKCVEVVPHIPEEVIRRIERASAVNRADVTLIEIGGTVGEYQNLLFLEAARMMHLRNPGQVQFILVSYLPIPEKIGEMKTKPTQYAVRTLNSSGIQPDFILCRASQPLDKPRKERLSINCNMQTSDIISAPDVDSVYEVPLQFEREGLSDKILVKFGLRARARDLTAWTQLVRRMKTVKRTVRIGLAGKYFTTGAFTLLDSYISVIEAVKHAAWANGLKPEIVWLDAEAYERAPETLAELAELDGLIVPGGFGSRGIEGKIRAITYARTNGLPYFGLCYGMQLAVVEFARSALKLRGAHTTEIDPATPYPVIDILPEQKRKLAAKDYGGSMRLGDYRCRILPNSQAADAYGQRLIVERHRHRYELNNAYRLKLEHAGLRVTGVNPDRNLVEIVELANHPFFLGTQFHPELTSHPLRPHPLFLAFIRAAQGRRAAMQKTPASSRARSVSA